MKPKTYLSKTGKLAGKLEVCVSKKSAPMNKGGEIISRTNFWISKDGKWSMFAHGADGKKTADRKGILNAGKIAWLAGILEKCDLLNMKNHQPGSTHTVFVNFGGVTKLLIADRLEDADPNANVLSDAQRFTVIVEALRNLTEDSNS